jgi:carbon-monoxide dehydrogenase medium subunit
MTPFELSEPNSLSEALKMLDPDDPTVRPVAGGTALMLIMKAGVFRPSKLISLRNIEKKFSSIETAAQGLRIGAMTTLAALEASADVNKHAPVMTRTLKTLSNVRVRNVATAGGALSHGDPHMDLPPVLMALGATVTATDGKKERKIALEDLYAGYYETILARNELMSEILVPPQTGRRAVYIKCTTRAVHDWPTLGVAVSLGKDGKDARIVISAATEKPMRLQAAEQALSSGALDEKSFKQAGEAAADTAELTTDAHGSAAYKKELVRVYIPRALKAALAEKVGG